MSPYKWYKTPSSGRTKNSSRQKKNNPHGKVLNLSGFQIITFASMRVFTCSFIRGRLKIFTFHFYCIQTQKTDKKILNRLYEWEKATDFRMKINDACESNSQIDVTRIFSVVDIVAVLFLFCVYKTNVAFILNARNISYLNRLLKLCSLKR